MDSVLMRNPATGATQELQARETVRRTILLAAGWVQVPNVTVRIDDDLVVLAPGEQPTAAPGLKLVEVTTNNSAMPEFTQVPHAAPSPKRKRSQ